MIDFVEFMARWHCTFNYPKRSGTDPRDMIRALEQQLGARLPVEYESFLMNCGGVFLARSAYVELLEPFVGGSIQSIERFFGFLEPRPDGSLHPWDIESQVNSYFNVGSNTLIPIANASPPDLVCMSLSGKDAGCVYFHDYEHLELGGDGLGTMVDLLNSVGIDSSRMDFDQIVYEAEKVAPGSRTKAPGYGNLYLISTSFEGFLSALRSEPIE